MASLVSTILGTAGAWHCAMSLQREGQGRASRTIRLRLRVALRRNYPRDGCHALVVLSCHPRTGEICEEWGVMKATTAILEAHEDPKKTRLLTLRQLPKMHFQIWRLVSPQLTSVVREYFEQQIRSLVDFRNSAVFDHVPDAEDETYVVVSLRKCMRGGPLLPAPDTELGWAPTHCHKQALSKYLPLLLSRIGGEDIAVYGSLDGRALVPYQALVQRRDWDRAWILLAAPWAAQRTAYRRQFGGTHAPELSLGGRPRFAQPEKGTDLESVDSCPVEQFSSGCELPVRGTFVHFGMDFVPHQPTSFPGKSVDDLFANKQTVLAC